MSSRKKRIQERTIMISRWERELILRFGYPFDCLAQQLKASGDADFVLVKDNAFYWEKLILNLAISVKEIPELHDEPALLESVLELIGKIEDVLNQV